MDVDTHFLEFEYFNYDNDKPPKVNFPYGKFRKFEFYFSIHMQNAFYIWNMVKHALKT
jgi:hypothetical protein